MPPRNGPSGISRAITPEQERLLEETWSNTQTPTQDELVLVQRQSGLSAAKIRQWFEKRRNPDAVVVQNTSKVKHLCTSTEWSRLWGVFTSNNYPSTEEKACLGEELGMTTKQVSAWFSHQRRIKKAKAPAPPTEDTPPTPPTEDTPPTPPTEDTPPTPPTEDTPPTPPTDVTPPTDDTPPTQMLKQCVRCRRSRCRVCRWRTTGSKRYRRKRRRCTRCRERCCPDCRLITPPVVTPPVVTPPVVTPPVVTPPDVTPPTDTLNVADTTNDTSSSFFDLHEPSLVEENPGKELGAEEAAAGLSMTVTTSKRGHVKLIDPCGYEYCLKRARKDGTSLWNCIKRSSCRGQIVQSACGLNFDEIRCHSCTPKLSVCAGHKIRNKLKQLAIEDVFTSARSIAEKVLHEELEDGAPVPEFCSKTTLSQLVNKTRAKLRPKEPKDLAELLDHVVDTEWLESFGGRDFYRGDVEVVNAQGKEKARHFIFATDDQLNRLQAARTWFLDGTFSVAKDPIYQLWTINVFLQKDGEMVQVPVLAVLMSNKRELDYQQVLNKILEVVPDKPSVGRMVVDFEEALWRAIGDIFPTVKIMGCVFHWAQCVYKRIQKDPNNLRFDYATRSGVNLTLRAVQGLPYLPASKIREEFEVISRQAEGQPRLCSFLSYVRRVWIENQLWAPETWSVYRFQVRTNNHIEGWHNRLRRRTNSNQLGFYVLIMWLWKEAQDVKVTAQLLNANQVKTYQKKETKAATTILYQMWDDYKEGSLSATDLCRKAGNLNFTVERSLKETTDE